MTAGKTELEREIYDQEDAGTSPDVVKMAWESILQNRNGRRVMLDLLREAGYGTPAHFSGIDYIQIASGKHEIANYIMSMINLIAPDAYYLMTKEAKEDFENDRNNRTSSKSK